MSDPTHLGNSNEHQKLYKVAPNLKEGFDVPLRDQIKPRQIQPLDRLGSGFIDWDNLGDSLAIKSDKGDWNNKHTASENNNIAFSSERRNTQVKMFKSDKSESSIADQMDVTPSDYNP